MTNAFEDFIAGWIAGMAALVIGHPFDTIKVRQQVLHAPLLQAITYTFKHEGSKGFYKGFLFPSLMIGPSNAVFFGCYGSYMRLIGKEGQRDRVQLDNPNWERDVFVGGTLAGLVQVFVTCPMEVVKTTLQMQTKNKDLWKAKHESKATGLTDCIRLIWKSKGYRWFFRGITPMLYRDCPTSGIYTLTYEKMVNWHYGIEFFNHKLLKQTIAGGMAGVLSWVFVIPFDVIKSKMQGDNMEKPKFKNMYHCFTVTKREYGWKYFFQGSLPVIARSFPFNASVFVTYEYVMTLFKSFD